MSEDGCVPGGSRSGRKVMFKQRLRSPLWSQLGPALSSSHCSASDTSRRLLAFPHRSEMRRGKLSCSVYSRDTGIYDQINLLKLIFTFKEFDTYVYPLWQRMMGPSIIIYLLLYICEYIRLEQRL